MAKSICDDAAEILFDLETAVERAARRARRRLRALARRVDRHPVTVIVRPARPPRQRRRNVLTFRRAA